MWTKDNIEDQTGKTIIVTGANTGIGYETALVLYEKGAHVVLACRSQKNAEHAITRIKQHKGNGSLEPGILDLSDLTSVKKFAGTFIQKHQQLHVLINNAGVAVPPATLTTEGYELQFGVNFLGHFALTGHLYPLLRATAGARVVTLSSMGYLSGAIDFENLRSEISYNPIREYRRSKLANILFSVELHRRITATGDKVLSVATQPGANNTELVRHMSEEAAAEGIKQIGGYMEPWQGALSSLYAAVSPDVAGGDFYEPDAGYRGYPVKSTIEPKAMDEELARQLWQMAEQATGMQYPIKMF
ncbi:SDR family NAD(P)-dependent oxidoreductase [Chitinophaga oryziterrae]|uniref:SDR family NAD(P)-dependent oxidoreductase n=1 Tax=Chitinophaga oryziterrae TaxID=1031224 RepID=A0A6N8JGW5_9BACT|nr:oxidoreductase [Chitinophaga oryziterrae]MVT43538.1 SDR family NAD(P)-dependent oxidoreductase [Chitinophaga oryziterrae]